MEYNLTTNAATPTVDGSIIPAGTTLAAVAFVDSGLSVVTASGSAYVVAPAVAAENLEEAPALDLQKYSNVFHYLSAEQFFAENRKDWTRSADLLNAISLLQAARNDLAPEWIASTRAFVARHPQLVAARNGAR